jgi:hypothetical protein
MIFDHIIQEPSTGQIAVRDKRLAHRLARVVISGDSQNWHVQRRYERAPELFAEVGDGMKG